MKLILILFLVESGIYFTEASSWSRFISWFGRSSKVADQQVEPKEPKTTVHVSFDESNIESSYAPQPRRVVYRKGSISREDIENEKDFEIIDAIINADEYLKILSQNSSDAESSPTKDEVATSDKEELAIKFGGFSLESLDLEGGRIFPTFDSVKDKLEVEIGNDHESQTAEGKLDNIKETTLTSITTTNKDHDTESGNTLGITIKSNHDEQINAIKDEASNQIIKDNCDKLKDPTLKQNDIKLIIDQPKINELKQKDPKARDSSGSSTNSTSIRTENDGKTKVTPNPDSNHDQTDSISGDYVDFTDGKTTPGCFPCFG